MIDIDTSSKKEQRKFGLLMAAAITVLGLLRYALHGFAQFPVGFFGVALLFAILGLIAPRVLQPALVGWLKFAIALNWVMTRLLLGFAFYLMFTPVRFIIRIFGEDPLKRQWLPGASSYWEEPEEQPDDFERYRNQF
jgi:hypothetical protein